ncbi:MAG: YggT family protein [Bordetella sp.]|nr:MAG: YggT family protein [Bordetella sp.]
MFGDILRFLLEITFNLFGAALITRIWIYSIRLHSFHPLSRSVIQITDWLIIPIQKIVRPGPNLDWSSLIGSWLTALVYLISIWMSTWKNLIPSHLTGSLIIAAFVTISKWSLNLIIWLTLIQTILSWLNPMAPMMSLLKILTAPLLDPIRKMLPSTTIIDFSPLIILVLSQVGLMIQTRIIFYLLKI